MSIAGLLQPQKKTNFNWHLRPNQFFPVTSRFESAATAQLIKQGIKMTTTSFQAQYIFFQTCCCLISIKHTENYATFFACGINTTQHNLVFQKKHTNAYPVDPPFGTSHKGMCTLLLENPRQVQYVTPARIGRSPTEKGRKRAVLLCAARPGDRAQSDLPFQASLNALLESRGSRDGCQRERSSVSRASK